MSVDDKTANVISLFASSSTLVCCALPALFVVMGAGASFASLVTALPFLITVSQYKLYLSSFALILILIADTQTIKLITYRALLTQN